MAQRQTSPGLKGRVLVVDDDATVRELLTAILEPQGFEVQTASNGPAALAAFHIEPFDIIFTDFQMPGMSGLELAAEVRKTDPLIPITLITGMADTLAAEAVAQAGIDRMLAKPFTPHELLHWVDACLPLRPDDTRLGRQGLASLVA